MASVLLAAGNDLVATCGSVILQVLSGPVAAEFVAEDGRVFSCSIPQDNTLTGTAIAVQPVDFRTGTFPAGLIFSDVTQPGFTSLTTIFGEPPPPVDFVMGEPPLFYDLTTTAEFSGLVTVSIYYSGVSFSGDEGGIRLFQLEEDVWIDRTTLLNIADDLISAEVTSLAPFAIFEPQVAPTPTPTPVPSLSQWGLGIMAGLMAVSLLWRLRRDRRAGIRD